MAPDLKGASKPYPQAKVQSCRESGALESRFNGRRSLDGAEVGVKMLQIPHVSPLQIRGEEPCVQA